jgi:hypothetical protein
VVEKELERDIIPSLLGDSLAVVTRRATSGRLQAASSSAAGPSRIGVQSVKIC